MELGEYDHRAVEAAARELWESHDVYVYDRDGQGPVFSVVLLGLFAPFAPFLTEHAAPKGR